MVIDAKQVIAEGEITITGRLVDASNATLFGKATFGENESLVIYKPVAGERPLWDFQEGTLAQREVAAYLFSEWSGFSIVPFTVLRHGPFGIGSVQEWITIDESIDLIELAQSRDRRLRAMAIFDSIINNTDRKIGHLLPTLDGRILGCDHGVCFHTEDKLRTVLWQWESEELSDEELIHIEKLRDEFSQFQLLAKDLLTGEELEATKNRIERLLISKTFPSPSEEWPAIPWPPI